jgi:hypothetical protein
MMSSNIMQPRERHLREVLHIFSYLKHHNKAVMKFNDWDETAFSTYDWILQYSDAQITSKYVRTT